MYGFGKALASTIVSYVLFFIAYIIFIAFLSLNSASLGYEESVSGAVTQTAYNPTGFVFFMLMCIGAAIPMLIMAIQSIKTSRARKKEGHPFPIAPFILGIHGTLFSALTLYMGLLFFMILLAV